MPFSVLDLVVLGIVVVSALLAAVRGVTREVLAIIAWVAAAAVAWSFHPMLLPTAKQYIHSDTVALVASIAAIFLVTLVVVSLVTVKISDVVLDSRIGAIDRSLGFLFGAARGFLICVIGWVFLSWLVQDKDRVPEWAAQARTRPMLEKSGDMLKAQLPENPELLLKNIKKPKVDVPPNEPVDAPAEEAPQRRTDGGAAPAPRR